MASFQSAGAVAINQLENLPFRNIIGGPLVAAIEAQAMAAETTVDFIKGIGFEEIDGRLSAVTLTFSYEDSSGNFRRVIVPLLSVIPIPFIVIDTIDIQFKAKISASSSDSLETSSQESSSLTGSIGLFGKRISLTGSYSTKKDSKATQESKYSVEYTMDVQVHASQAGIPQGMAQILNILQDGISNQASSLQLTVIGLDRILLSTSTGEAFSLLVLDAAGQPVSKATIELQPQLGLIAGTVTESTTDPGIYHLNIKPVPKEVSALTTDTNETINLTVTVLDSTLSLSRVVTVRNIADPNATPPP